MGAIGAAAILTCAGVLALGYRFANESPATPASAPVLAVSPPPGWVKQATWATGELAAEAGVCVAVGTDLAYVTAGRRVVVADADTGDRRWEAELPAGPIRGPLAHTRIGDTEVVAVHIGDHLHAWSVASGDALADIALPAQAQVTYLGEAPLIGIAAATVAVVTDSGLTPVSVPGGAYALAARQDGSVTAASSAGWWHLRPGRPSGAPTIWENPTAETRPADSRPTVIGYLDRSIVLRYPAFGTAQPEIVVHTDNADSVRVSFRGPARAAAGEPSAWFPSAAGTWAVLGRTLIDTRAGSVHDLGSWSTTAVSGQRAFGTVNRQAAMTGPGINPVALPSGTDTPELVTNEVAVIRVEGPVTNDQGQLDLPAGAQSGVIVPAAS